MSADHPTVGAPEGASATAGGGRKTPVSPAPGKRKATAPRSQAERRETTSRAILDAAETLFAEHGRDGVTIKAIAAKVGVNTALVHYYFGDGVGVFEAVWQRRASVINPVRLDVLNAYESAHAGAMTPRGIIYAFLRPVLEYAFQHGDGWSNFMSLVGMTNTTRYGGAFFMDEHFDAVVYRLIDMLLVIAPDMSRTALFWLIHHLLGSLTFTMTQTGRIDRLSKGLCHATDMEDALESSVAIFAAGFEALRRG